MTPPVAAEEQPQHAHEVGLRLDRDHPGPERAPGPDAAADVRADVEPDVARAEELAVEPHHPAVLPGTPWYITSDRAIP